MDAKPAAWIGLGAISHEPIVVLDTEPRSGDCGPWEPLYRRTDVKLGYVFGNTKELADYLNGLAREERRLAQSATTSHDFDMHADKAYGIEQSAHVIRYSAFTDSTYDPSTIKASHDALVKALESLLRESELLLNTTPHIFERNRMVRQARAALAFAKGI